MVFIYVLQLEEGKYYIGKTTNPSFILKDHFTQNVSSWTKKYKPIKVFEFIKDCYENDEDGYTIKYMEKYGINNVRGGSFYEIKLSENNITTLNQIINNINDKCYICGIKGHFAKDCKTVSVKKEKIPTIDLNEKCDCPTSYFSSHRRIKCVLNNMLSYFDDENDNIDNLIKQEIVKPDNILIKKDNFLKQEIIKPKNIEIKKDNINIYVLKLVNNKYYVGKSENVEKRFEQHINGNGSSWTKLYKPISIEKVIENANIFDEDNITKQYMSLHGIDNVRGGSYVTEILNDIQKYTLKKEIWSAKDLCSKCGRPGHFIKDCYAKKDIDGDIINDVEEIEYSYICKNCHTEFESEKECLKHEKYCDSKKNKNSCFRCGREGHYSPVCYAKKYIYGYIIEYEIEYNYVCENCDMEFENEKECLKHEKKCNSKKTNNSCFRCGRDGHYSSDCYATKHIKGCY